MATRRNWWRHIRSVWRIGRRGCLCKMWWFCIKQSSNELLDFLQVALVLRTFVQYLIAVCSRQEANRDVLSGRFVVMVVPDRRAGKFCNPGLNIWEKFDPKPPETAFSIIFRYKFWPEVASDVVSGVATDLVGLDVSMKLFVYSSSNCSWDIPAAHFVMDDERRRKYVMT